MIAESSPFPEKPLPNPTVPRWVYEPGLAARESRMNPVPRVGEARPLLRFEAEDNVNAVQLTNATDTVLYNRLAMFGNLNLLDGLPKVVGNYSLFLSDVGDVLHVLYGPTEPPAGLLDFLSVGQINVPGKVTEWVPRPSHLPWVTGGQQPIFADAPTTLLALGAKDFDLRRVVYLPTQSRGLLTATNASTPAVLTREFASQKVRIEVQTTEPTLVVISQAFYHNWHATLDGQSTPLLRANHAFQAVEVPAGKHEIVLRYQDRTFQIGTGISLLALAGCLVAGWRMRSTAMPGAVVTS